MTLRLLLVAPLALLTGCIGTLYIGAQDDDDSAADDDDASGPDLDFGTYTGFEFINIDWDQETGPVGVQDCIGEAGWDVTGTETTADDQETRCPACDHIWTLSYSLPAPTNPPTIPLAECLESTGLPPLETFERKLGFEFDNDQDFVVWRNFDDPDTVMKEVGEGALDEDATHTWSGVGRHRFDEQPSLEYYFSGEGGF